ncbi:YihY/virulence factor BrkB family protein, partial [Mesorhizobium sp. IMUNJ23232]
AVASSYGAAGSLIVLLLWVFYSSSIFLLGAELTRAYATSFGTRPDLKRLTTSVGDAPIPSQPRIGADSNTYIAVALIAFVSALTTMVALSKSRNRGS